MKIRNLTKILVLALSLALLMTAAIGITASAEGEEVVDNRGDIYSTSIVHNDKIGIAIAVKATAEEIANNTVTVKYQWADEAEPKTATYFGTHENQEGYVWVVTEGVAAYDLAREATITSYLNENQVESGKYSVATFLYTKLYKDGVTGAAQECYEALLAYGAASQTFLNQNADAPVNALNYAYTKNADVKINGASSALASEVTLTYNGNFIVESWVVDGVEYPVSQTTFEIDGVTEIDVAYAEDLTFTISKGSYTAENGTWVYNEDVTNICANKIVIYDKSFTGTLMADTYGMSYILGSDGTLKGMYDGGNGSYYYGSTDGTRTKFSGNHIALAFADLEEGDILIVVPRYYPDGATENPARAWAQSVRWGSYLGSDQYTGSPVGQAATLTYTPAEK